tara:strand:- start:135 stop:458 length:324 start_codon:yes stop_codon:yes gene_type:complete
MADIQDERDTQQDKVTDANVAPMAEQRPCKAKVPSSSLGVGSTYDLYEIQLETDKAIYRFEIGVDNYDAKEWAEIYLASELNVYGPFHIGGYKRIGTTDRLGIIVHP